MNFHLREQIGLSRLPHLLICLSVLLFCPFLSLAADQIITETKVIKKVQVTIVYQGGVFWRADIENSDGKSPLSIIWDASSYTSSGGRTSRLVPAGNRTIHPEDKQENTIIPPGQKNRILFTSEDFMPYADLKTLPAPSEAAPQGILKIAFKRNGTHLLWRGSVKFLAQKKQET